MSNSGTSRSKKTFFYGWKIVGVMGTAAAVSMGMGTLNFGLFIKPMGDELGIGRSTFGWAFSVRQVASAVSSPLIGGILDRYGSRILLPVAVLITAVALSALALINASWQLIVLFGVMGIVGLAGGGSLVTTVPVTKWFVTNRGKAVAYASLGLPIGALIFVPLTQVFIDLWGWRIAWVVLSTMAASIIIPLSLIFLRREPEDLGLYPDGIDPNFHDRSGSESPIAPVAPEVSWTAREAMRSYAFWQLVAVFGMVALAVGTVGVHRIPAFMDRGLDPTLVSIATALDAVLAGVSTFTMGMLVSRVEARYLGAAGFSFLAIASVLTIYATTLPIMFLSMAVFGMGIGGMMFLQTYIWADYFGRAHLGRIRGIVMPITLIVGGAGAPVAGYVRDSTGSYNSIWWVGVVLMVLAAALASITVAPRKNDDGGDLASATGQGQDEAGWTT
ncbi:MAG: MFS transporter [Chloroflexi bacterium]|nr:MFS transporter [Chloroflexota bacterium]